ncbi:MAG: hypothetical protein JXA77_11320 [Bacteroidales bacterium]|nr:hypothetical protein [Bacteroidales bacterium]
MSLTRHIWEGWTVQDFINELELPFSYKTFKTRDEVKKWCKENQPYYKKHIPEVASYFIKKAGL